MSDAYTKQWEGIIDQMLTPLRGLPFHLVIKKLSGHDVVAVDRVEEKDRQLVTGLEKAIGICAREIATRPIKRPRPNEVGNDVESFVRAALEKVGFRVERPQSRSGAAKAVGYPDILLYDSFDRPTYVECKTYDADTVGRRCGHSISLRQRSSKSR
jgi:hypothetical protein